MDLELGEPSYLDIDDTPAAFLLEPDWSFTDEDMEVKDVVRLPGVVEVTAAHADDITVGEGIAESLYYSWSKEFLEAGKRRLAGDTARAASSSSGTSLRLRLRTSVLQGWQGRTRTQHGRTTALELQADRTSRSTPIVLGSCDFTH